MGAGGGLEDAGDGAERGARDGSGEDGQGEVEDRREVQAEADDERADHAEDHLALGADVEQARAEGEADGEAGEDQRGGVGEGLGDRAQQVADLGGARGHPVDGVEVEDRALEQGAVGVRDDLPGGFEGVGGPGEEVAPGAADGLVGDDEEDRSDEEGQQQGVDRDHDRVRLGQVPAEEDHERGALVGPLPRFGRFGSGRRGLSGHGHLRWRHRRWSPCRGRRGSRRRSPRRRRCRRPRSRRRRARRRP